MSAHLDVAPGIRGMPQGLPRVLPIDRKLFPDGLRTSGQHPPVPSQLRAFEEFPREISGSTVWTPQEMINHPEQWIHRWTEDELQQLLEAVEDFIALGTPLVNISKSNFRMPKFEPELLGIRDDILNGRGFIVF